jgi:hypothetical protein
MLPKKDDAVRRLKLVSHDVNIASVPPSRKPL